MHQSVATHTPQPRIPIVGDVEPAKAKLKLLRTKLLEQRFVTNTILGDNNNAQFVLGQLRKLAREAILASPSICAVALLGSRVNGTAMDKSDVDLLAITDRFIDTAPAFFEGKEIPASADKDAEKREFDFRYQNHWVRTGLSDNGQNVLIKLRRFLLAARPIYFDRMARILKDSGSYDFGFIMSEFAHSALDVQYSGATPRFVGNVAKKLGVPYFVVEEVFRKETYYLDRRAVGIVGKNEELARLEEDAHQLGSYLIT